MIRSSIALLLLSGAVAADPVVTDLHATALKTFDAIGSSAAFLQTHPGLAKRYRRQDFGDQACAPNMASIPGGMAGVMAFTQGECSGFMENITIIFRGSNTTAESYEGFCENRCLVPTLRFMRSMMSAIPDIPECHQTARAGIVMVNMIPSLICPRNHLGIRCGAVLLASAGLRSEAEGIAAHPTDNATIEGLEGLEGGQAAASLYGLTLTSTQRTQYAGACGQLEAAGCCMRSTFASVLGLMGALGGSAPTNAPNATAALAAVKDGLVLAKAVCAAAGRPSANIGARACPMATVRNGDMPSGAGVAGAPAALAVRRRLRLTFAGDYSALTPARKTALEASIKTTVEEAMGAGSVESVTLTAGSINAQVNFATDVTADEVSALATDVSIVQMAPDDGAGTSFTQASLPTTVDSTVGTDSAASAAFPTALGLAGLVAGALMM